MFYLCFYISARAPWYLHDVTPSSPTDRSSVLGWIHHPHMSRKAMARIGPRPVAAAVDMPYPPAHRHIGAHLAARHVHQRDMVRAPQRHHRRPAVGREADAAGQYAMVRHARNGEMQRLHHLEGGRGEIGRA